jgi:HlyD family secretion protein
MYVSTVLYVYVTWDCRMLLHKLRIERGDAEVQLAPVLTSMDRPVARRLITRERVIVALVLAFALAVGAYGYVHYGLTRSISVDVQRLTVSPVEHAVFHDYVLLSGTVAPRKTQYLDAVVGGQVAEALVEEGAQVVAGQPLVVFKNANLQLQTMSQEAQTTQQLFQLTSLNQSLEEQHLQRASQLAEADYQVRTLTAERKRPLLARGFVSRAEIEGLERSLAREQRKYANLQAAAQADDAARPEKLAQVRKSIDLITGNLAITRKNLDALTLRAPISGQLTMLDAETGAAKSAGARIGQIDSADGFKVRAAGSEYYFARVMTGQKATVEINDRTYGLHVTKVYPGVKNQEFTIDLTFDAQPPAIHRDQALQLKLEIGASRPSIMVRNGAWYDDAGGQWVFALSPGAGSAERRTVRLGRRNPDNIEVLSGLTPGERIITSSYEPYLTVDRIDIRGLSQGGAAQP